jgi:hypothetical protein
MMMPVYDVQGKHHSWNSLTLESHVESFCFFHLTKFEKSLKDGEKEARITWFSLRREDI